MPEYHDLSKNLDSGLYSREVLSSANWAESFKRLLTPSLWFVVTWNLFVAFSWIIEACPWCIERYSNEGPTCFNIVRNSGVSFGIAVFYVIGKFNSLIGDKNFSSLIVIFDINVDQLLTFSLFLFFFVFLMKTIFQFMVVRSRKNKRTTNVKEEQQH